MNMRRLSDIIRDLLLAIGEDPERGGLVDTPDRVARMYAYLFRGLYEDPPELRMFDNPGNSHMIIVKDLSFNSVCVPSKQHVNGVDGSVPASKVVVGDELWTLDNYGMVQKTTVKDVSSHLDVVYEIRTTKGVVRVTGDHPFATENGWVEARNLAGESVEWTPAHSLCRFRCSVIPSYSLGYFIGATMSDGTTGKNYVSLVVNDEEFASKYRDSIFEAFGISANVEPVSRPSGFTKKDTPGFRVRVVSSYIADLMRMWSGGDTHHMRQEFPKAVLYSSSMFKGFIDGYVDGDGSIRKSGGVIFSSNISFLNKLGVILKKEPVLVSSSHMSEEHGMFADSYRLYVPQKYMTWEFTHGFSPEIHRLQLAESEFVPVLSVQKLDTGVRSRVYSFTCSPYPTFLIQGHLTHNCEHHLVPFMGRAAIGYIPSDKLVGLSKFARVVDHFAARPQIQERLTNDVLSYLVENINPSGLIVHLEAEHFCMTIRGVQKPGHLTQTAAFMGDFEDQGTRAEFYSNLNR